MRRFFLGMAIASLTAGAPLTAFGGDREIADAIVSTLKQKQTDGSLKGFDIDLSVEDGRVVIGGSVANQKQLDSVLNAANATTGVNSVVSNVTVRSTASNIPSYTAPSSQAKAIVPASANEDTLSEPPKLADETPATVSPVDEGITSDILSRLGHAKSSGRLRNFDLDISTVDGEVWARGFVATQDQKQLVLGTAQRVPGVRKVVDDIAVTGQGPVRTASGVTPASPAVAVGSGAPRAFAPSSLSPNAGVPAYNASMTTPMADPGMGAPAAPVRMQGGPSYGGGVPRYDQPNMPSYAWPSYASYPNYAAVTYPKQYSASAWPYIGPFYPYPQVPLGWRKVSLEWDDGLWYLDFTHK